MHTQAGVSLCSCASRVSNDRSKARGYDQPLQLRKQGPCGGARPSTNPEHLCLLIPKGECLGINLVIMFPHCSSIQLERS